jgi:translation initiation factor RLI1
VDNSNFNAFQREITIKFEELKKKQESYFDTNVLNSGITSNEILKAIKTLKNGKSSSIDLISNEIIKNNTHILLESLTHEGLYSAVGTYFGTYLKIRI